MIQGKTYDHSMFEQKKTTAFVLTSSVFYVLSVFFLCLVILLWTIYTHRSYIYMRIYPVVHAHLFDFSTLLSPVKICRILMIYCSSFFVIWCVRVPIFLFLCRNSIDQIQNEIRSLDYQ